MNLKTFLIEELLKVQHTGIVARGMIQATPEQIQNEINRRVKLARDMGRTSILFVKYQSLGLI